MGTRGPKHLRKTTNHVLDAFAQAAEQAYRDHPIGMNAVKDLIEGLKVSSAFDDFYRRAYREMMEIVEAEKLEQKRTNAFGRLMCHPLSDLFDAGDLDRDILPNVFSFIHLVLGDDGDKYAEQCQKVLKELREAESDEFSWEDFYADRRCKLILWHSLVRIAVSFKRWDIRKDWFMKLMQYTPTTVSLGQSAFVVKEHDVHEEPRVFGNRQFCLFFQAMFRPLIEIAPDDESLFRKEFGADPHHHIGEFLVHLTACA